MKKTLRILALTLLLLLTSCSWIGAASREESSSSISTSSLAISSGSISESTKDDSSAAQSTIAATVALDGAWEHVKEHEGTKYHFRLTFAEDGSIEYAVGWYQSELAEVYIGTYAYDGKVLDFSAEPTMYPEETSSLRCIANLEVDGDTLKTSYNSADKMHFFQGDEIDVWTVYIK